MADSIILIGFMGCGKSTVGRNLADMLDYSFIDTDTEIERKCNMSISDMFAQKGEPYFRLMEKEVILGIDNTESHVISCGGGSILNPDILNHLKELGKLVYLRANPDTTLKRTAGNNARPLLNSDDRRERIMNLMAERENIYLNASDMAIDTDLLSAKEVAINIKKQLKY